MSNSKILDKACDVSGFLKAIASGLRKSPLAKSVFAATPWLGSNTLDVANATLGFIHFALVKVKQFVGEPSLEQEAMLACNIAYVRAIEQAIKSQDRFLRLPPIAVESFVPDSLPSIEEVNIRTFRMNEHIFSHDFVVRADGCFAHFCEAVGIDPASSNRLIQAVHRYFQFNLMALSSSPETAKAFAKFISTMTQSCTEYESSRAISNYIHSQWWLFNSAPVFGQEQFSLSHVYTETDCGELTWGQVYRENRNPFLEGDSTRINLLEGIKTLLRSPDLAEPIVIQGVAGSGKSTMTLRLVCDLIEEGLIPIRIPLGNLDLKLPLLSALPKSISHRNEFPLGQDAFQVREEWFKALVSSREFCTFGGIQISPYVLIFDGWDEVSTGATKGFRDDLGRLLSEIRSHFIDHRASLPPIRVVFTGRPSVDVTNRGFLTDDTPILTIRPFTPKQLEECFELYATASRERPLSLEPVFIDDEGEKNQSFQEVFSTYREGYEAMLVAHSKGRFEMEPSQKLAVLGQPLLAHLALKLVTELKEGSQIKDLAKDQTTLYRALVDMTYERGGKLQSASHPLKGDRFRVTGVDLRKLLWHTAQAISATGNESITRAELALRLPWETKDLRKLVSDTTKDNVLSGLIIGFFFKEGNSHQGCQFMHKSFREYLFAEGVVEILKEYGELHSVKKAFSGNSRGFKQRDVYWKDFDDIETPPGNRDPRFDFVHNLATIFATHWITPEIRGYIKDLIYWEMERSHRPSDASWPGKPTQSVSVETWERIRDGIADVWDWWAEGVHLRPRPYLDPKHKTPRFHEPYVIELSQICSPLDPDTWNTDSEDIVDVVRITTVDSRLGDSFFHLAAVVHAGIIETGEKWSSQAASVGSQTQIEFCRRYQFKVNGENLYRFAPGGRREDTGGGYFINFMHRINAAGWRPGGSFPAGIFGDYLCLAGETLRDCELTNASLRRSSMFLCKIINVPINGANFIEADMRGTTIFGMNNFYGEFLPTSLHGADLRNAEMHSVDVCCDMQHVDLSDAKLTSCKFIDCCFSGASFERIHVSKTSFENSSGVPSAVLEAASPK